MSNYNNQKIMYLVGRLDANEIARTIDILNNSGAPYANLLSEFDAMNRFSNPELDFSAVSPSELSVDQLAQLRANPGYILYLESK